MSYEIPIPPAERRPHGAPAPAPSAQPPLRPPVRDVLERFAGHFARRPGFAADEHGIAFDNDFPRTTLRFATVDCPLPGGQRVIEVAELRSELPEALHDLTDREIAVFNTHAALGALLRDPASGRPVLVSRTTLWAGDDAMLRRYGMLLHAAALTHPTQLAAAIMPAAPGDARPGDAETSPSSRRPSPWHAEELALVARLVRCPGYRARIEETLVAAELPWEPGRIPVPGEDRRVSLLGQTTREPHRLLGDGLWCKLELPLACHDPARQAALANGLNQLEAQALDGPPFLGAWCAVPAAPRVAWVSFLPDVTYRPGLAASVAAWMVMRERFVREAMSARRV
jgi:hypothetical protein